jgi:hypothetical protein
MCYDLQGVMIVAKRHQLVLMLILALAGAAVGEVFEIPLPELVGTYAPGTYYRHLDLHITPLPATIDSIQFRTSGFFEAGLWNCGYGPECWPFFVDSMLYDPDAGWWDWYFMGPCSDAEMTVTSTYEESSFHQPGWDFLLDGHCSMSYSVSPDWTVGDCYPVTGWIVAEIYEAVIIVYMDPLVAAEDLSWGRVKTLYR